jgi:hypothetical protein
MMQDRPNDAGSAQLCMGAAIMQVWPNDARVAAGGAGVAPDGGRAGEWCKTAPMVQGRPNYGGPRQVCRVGPVLEGRPSVAGSAQWCEKAPMKRVGQVVQDGPGMESGVNVGEPPQ